MPRFAANLSMLFNEVDFLDRFAAAKAAGFEAVEFLFPYDYKPEELASRLKDNGLTQALFNMPPGDWANGERGTASLPGREAEFREGVDKALTYAKALGCKQVHAMAGIPSADAPKAKARQIFLDNLTYARDRLAPEGVTILLEPINQRDMPGFHLSYQEEAAEIIESLGEGVGLQFDVYHCQIMQGDIEKRLRALKPIIRHVQIAGVPDRHEPDAGEVNYPHVFRVLDEIGYDGWVGCEYRPAGRTEDGLGWMKTLTA